MGAIGMTEDDEQLAARIRTLMLRREGYSEKNMFGGTAFFLHGHMCVGPWKGSLIVRLDRNQHDATQSEPHVFPMDVTGKVMRGWARIAAEGIRSDAQLRSWVERAIAYVSTLPPK